MKKTFIGIDPGKNGGIAVLTGEWTWHAERYPINGNARDVKELFEYCVILSKNIGIYQPNIEIYIEQVHAMPMDGRSSLFKFGVNYGTWLGITAGYNINLVSPQKWQKFYGELPKEKKERKNKLKEWATNMVSHTDIKPTLCTSDAILIANYGRENHEY